MRISNMFLGAVPGHRVKIPIPVRIERKANQQVFAVWELTDDFGFGKHMTSAVADLASTVSEGFDGLVEREHSLSDHLKHHLWIYRQHLEKRKRR